MSVFTNLLKSISEEFTQELLVFFLNFSREYARQIAKQEQEQGLAAGQLFIELLEGKNFPENHQYQIDIQVLDTLVHSNKSNISNNPQWKDSFIFNIRNIRKDLITIQLNIIDVNNGWLMASAIQNIIDWDQPVDIWININPVQPTTSLSTEIVSGSIHLKYNFLEWWQIPIEGRGFVYDNVLPVLSPNVELPIGAEPNEAFKIQDKMMKEAMGAIIYYWESLGQTTALATLPKPLNLRIDWADSDEYFVNRRMNGYNPGFFTINNYKSEENPWDFEIEWDLSYFNPHDDYRPNVLWPEYICVHFSLSNDQKSLKTHSITYILDGIKHFVLNDDSPEWKKAKSLYLYVEVNLVFNWTHVGVHFDVEQYAMAVCRNLTPENPIWKLLMPHFINIIYNDREVIRPTIDGAVSIAGPLTYSGQMKMVYQRMSKLTFKWEKPPQVIPLTVNDNEFDRASLKFWDITQIYVNKFIDKNKEEIMKFMPNEIKLMSNDLEFHSCNKIPGSMNIDSIEDLKKMCTYVIYQAIFYHDWLHWASYDDLYQSLFFRDDSIPEDIQIQMTRALMTQAFVTYASPTLRQWPIFDPELGAIQEPQIDLKNKLLQITGELNPSLLIGTYIMAPNT
jgi:hypothetical protein